MILKNMALILADGVCGALTGEYFNLSGTSKGDGNLVEMRNDTLYNFRTYDETLTPLYPTDSTCIVITDKGKMLVIDHKLNICDDYQSANIYNNVFSWGNYSVVTYGNGSACLIIHNDGRLIAHFRKKFDKMMLQGNLLYVLADGALWKVDFDTLAAGKEKSQNPI